MVSVVRERATSLSSVWMIFSVARIECRSGFVQNQDGRVLEHGAGNGDALFLAAGELEAAFAHGGIPAFGQRFDEMQDVRGACGLDHFCRGWPRADRRQRCNKCCR